MNRPHARDLVLGEQGWRWLRESEMSLLPRPVRPAAMRWAWAGLAIVLLGLAIVVLTLGMRL
ncbi:hypothetical protein [Amycolatopsis tolypomycina]|uniref:Uncharacterized protein n=1 Tax=Amycolatopsis tolypomycina TaxID=208445 RepID=A0A1H4JKT0_9PSEU|nr:hypothetical protein [Amycolatopsis tolypomycina]SEB46944.1 hypothetical protein SAMN04489727_1999 [Amycolatopsis tolypomycina]